MPDFLKRDLQLKLGTKMDRHLSISKTITEYINENHYPNNLTQDLLLLRDGILDSFSMMELIMFIEDRFNISFTEEELNPQTFESIKNISLVVAKKIN